MKPLLRTLLLLTALLPLAGNASDEIRGTVADVLAAIKGRQFGLEFAVEAVVAAPFATNDTRFVIRDQTGHVIVRRDFGWPDRPLRTGDAVTLRCEIGATASTPAAAFFRGLTVRARNASPGDAHGNWLVTARDDESANVLRLPRWLTAANVALVFGGLLALTLAALGWNALLRRLVDRRSRDLTAERLVSFTADLKVEERTRLAIELHDTIAQTLTGVALELDAARGLAPRSPAEAERHLDVAARALASCRNDLKNCMWDLRNQALDDDRLDTAIRRTLAPHLAGAALTVRFGVDRSLLSENTALAVLRIVRELTVNAVRHGHATAIRVAGCRDRTHLRFSVRDNGRGFDPATRPGVEQGHFGLQGVSERVEFLGGSLAIESSAAHGTSVRISFPLPPDPTPRT